MRVYEQNFEKNLINADGILDKYIEKEITVYANLGETTKRVDGKLLGFQTSTSGYILQTRFGINTLNYIVGVEFPTLPEGFFTLPTLNWKVWSSHAQENTC